MSFSKEKLLLYEHHIYTLKKAGDDVNTESLWIQREGSKMLFELWGKANDYA